MENRWPSGAKVYSDLMTVWLWSSCLSVMIFLYSTNVFDSFSSDYEVFVFDVPGSLLTRRVGGPDSISHRLREHEPVMAAHEQSRWYWYSAFVRVTNMCHGYFPFFGCLDCLGGFLTARCRACSAFLSRWTCLPKSRITCL